MMNHEVIRSGKTMITILSFSFKNNVLGPLMAVIKGRHTVIGVASFAGKPCHWNISKPGGFARVTSQLDWIRENSDVGRCLGDSLFPVYKIQFPH
jgi:hypothetical protein